MPVTHAFTSPKAAASDSTLVDGPKWNDAHAVTVATNTQTAAYTLVLADAGKAVELDSATAVTVTVPPNSSVAFPVGTVVEVYQHGAGQVTVAAGAGVTVHTPATLKLTGQYSTAGLRKRGTDEWVLVGDLAAS